MRRAGDGWILFVKKFVKIPATIPAGGQGWRTSERGRAWSAEPSSQEKTQIVLDGPLTKRFATIQTSKANNLQERRKNLRRRQKRSKSQVYTGPQCRRNPDVRHEQMRSFRMFDTGRGTKWTIGILRSNSTGQPGVSESRRAGERAERRQSVAKTQPDRDISRTGRDRNRRICRESMLAKWNDFADRMVWTATCEAYLAACAASQRNS